MKLTALLTTILTAGIIVAQTPSSNTPKEQPKSAAAPTTPSEIAAYWQAQAAYEKARADHFEELYMSTVAPDQVRSKQQADAFAKKVGEQAAAEQRQAATDAAKAPKEPAKK